MAIRSKISQTPIDKSTPQHTGKMLIEGIPEDTKTGFKAACARRQVTMRDVMIRFMQSYASEVLNS